MKELKKTGEELQEYIMLFRKRGSIKPAGKGRGSKYNRNKMKKEMREND